MPRRPKFKALYEKPAYSRLRGAFGAGYGRIDSRRGWTMRRILTIGLVCLMTYTSAASAADLTMPVKAPPPPEAPAPVAFEWWPLLFLIPVGLCIAFC